MREFKVTIGGKERLLRYTSRDGITLFNRFDEALPSLVLQKCAGSGGGRFVNPEAQLALVLLGLQRGQAPRDHRHVLEEPTEDDLLQWKDELMESGGDWREVVDVAVRAIYFAGVVTGKSFDWEPVLTKVNALRVGVEGKAQPAPEARPEEMPAIALDTVLAADT